MTKRMIFFACVFMVFSFLPPAVSAAPNMQEGQWEVTMKMEMKGMPAQMARPMKHTYCMTQKDMVPQKPEKDKNCEIKDQKISGNTVTWEMVCKDKDGDMRSKGKITYKGASFDGEMKSTMKSKDSGPMQVNYKMSGKRLGPCKQ